MARDDLVLNGQDFFDKRVQLGVVSAPLLTMGTGFEVVAVDKYVGIHVRQCGRVRAFDDHHLAVFEIEALRRDAVLTVHDQGLLDDRSSLSKGPQVGVQEIQEHFLRAYPADIPPTGQVVGLRRMDEIVVLLKTNDLTRRRDIGGQPCGCSRGRLR